jgi:hypothetical protein
MAKKKNAPVPIAGRLGPPPQTILRGGTHADKRRQPRGEQQRLAICEAFSFPAQGRPPHLLGVRPKPSRERERRTRTPRFTPIACDTPECGPDACVAPKRYFTTTVPFILGW